LPVVDTGERHDLAAQLPDKTKELNQKLSSYLAAMNAQMPAPNPNYDPGKPTAVKRGGNRKTAP
jgi:hypothetical protein